MHVSVPLVIFVVIRHKYPEKFGIHIFIRARAESRIMAEKGICIICGEMRAGAPAKPEFPVRAARWLRTSLRQPAKHTVACKEHFSDAVLRREKFERKQRSYGIGAIIFFLLTVAGSLFFGKMDWWVFLPGLLGAAFITMLPHFYYFPSFGK